MTADTAEPFDHRCQTADPRTGTSDSLAHRALPGCYRPLRTAASAEIA
ncbi:MAG TPA: hypothetical protein VMY37_12100 [Thermoguttaceae bacterium]|nr:hypothetical protein [Thermoguttaceae bacterium]